MDSILLSIKKLLGITEAYDHFDNDLILHINTTFSILHQLGVGPEDGFVIKGEKETWEMFLSDDKKLEMAKTLIFLKVKLLFDPPQSSSVLESYNNTISELMWRINIVADPGYKR